MTGSVKYKIRAGSAFLFLLVMISGGVSLYFIVKFRVDSKNVFVANYQSIEYGHKMQEYLDSIRSGNNLFIDSFASILHLQQSNITEPGELEATKALDVLYTKMRQGDASALSKANIQLQKITAINLNAIKE